MKKKETFRKSKKASFLLLQRLESLTTTEEATVYVRDLEMFDTVELLEDSPAVSLSKQIMRKTWVFQRMEGQTVTHSTQTSGKIINCKSEHFILRVVRGIFLYKSPKRCRCSIGRPNRRQLRETKSIVFQTGFSNLRNDGPKENLDHSVVLVKRFRKHFLHVPAANAPNITRAPGIRNPENREDKKTTSYNICGYNHSGS